MVPVGQGHRCRHVIAFILWDNTVDEELHEDQELVRSHERVDLVHDNLVVVAESVENHGPDWMVDLVQTVLLDFQCLHVLYHQHHQTVIVCVVQYLYKYGLIVHGVDEELMNLQEL